MSCPGEPDRDIHDVLRDVLGPLEGARVYGGCDDCDAFQTVEPVMAGVWKITVHHDSWCRWCPS